MIQIAEWPGAQRGSQRVFATAERVLRAASWGSAYTDHNETERLAIELGGVGTESGRSSRDAPPSRSGVPLETGALASDVTATRQSPDLRAGVAESRILWLCRRPPARCPRARLP